MRRSLAAYQTYETYNPRQLRSKLIAKAQDAQRCPEHCLSEKPKQPRDADGRPWSWSGPVSTTALLESIQGDDEARCQDVEMDVVHATIVSPPSRLRSLSRKRSVDDLRHARRLSLQRSQTFPGEDGSMGTILRPPITSADLNKPLPPLPVIEDTSVHTTWAPYVTHQTIRRDLHELCREHITHEYHQDEYQHRILPVIETEILPARHFIQLDGGGLEEISEDEIPGELPPELQERISQAAATIFPATRPGDTPIPSLDGSFDPRHCRPTESSTPSGHSRHNTTWTYLATMLPSQNGSESFHRLLLHVDGTEGVVGRTHIRSLSDGPPVIPPRHHRYVGLASVASV